MNHKYVEQLVALFAILVCASSIGCRNSSNQTSGGSDEPKPVTPPPITEEVEALVKQLESFSEDERTDAAIKLIEHPDQAAHFVVPLIELLVDPKSTPKLAADLAFRELGAKAVPPIETLLHSDKQEDIERACQAIKSIGEPASPLIPKLAELLKSEDPKKRQRSAMFAMIPMGDKVIEHLDLIEKVLDDKDFNTHIFACETIINIGPEAKSVGPRLVELSKNGNVSSRSYAYWALGAIGPLDDDFDTVAYLTPLLDEFLYHEKARAMRGLGLLGSKASSVADKVREIAADDRQDLAPNAAYCLWQVTGDADEAVEILLKAFRNPNQTYSCMQFLEEMGAAAKPAEEHLIKQLDNPDESIREMALLCLCNIKTESLPAIEKMQTIAKEDSDLMLRVNAKRALEKLEASK